MRSAEAIVDAALSLLAEGRIYPDVAPAGVVKPFLVYQSVGGVDETTFDGISDLQNSRMQVTVWSDSRVEAAKLMHQVLQALTDAPVCGKPIGAPVSEYELDTRLYGSRLDISIWFTV